MSKHDQAQAGQRQGRTAMKIRKILRNLLLLGIICVGLYFLFDSIESNIKSKAVAEDARRTAMSASCGGKEVIVRTWFVKGRDQSSYFCRETDGRLTNVTETLQGIWQDVHSKKTGDEWMDQAVTICLSAGYIGAIDLGGLNCVDKERHLVPYFHPMIRALDGGDKVFIKAKPPTVVPAK